jgi:hypothetical protein
VYLAGDVDPRWRVDLIDPAHHEAYAVAVQSGANDTLLTGALPYGHTMVGPYQTRINLDETDLVAKDHMETVRGAHLTNPERYRLRQIAKADIVFTWLTDSPGSRDSCVELGLAYGIGKAVVVAAQSRWILRSLPLSTEIAWKMAVAGNAAQAYKHVMADLDVTFERGMARIEAKYGGSCVVCRSSYSAGETIYWSKPTGGMHADCHARVNAPDELSSVVFNSELVRAVRAENADLEKQLLTFQTQVSMLEQEVTKEKAAYEELYADYLGWVHP